MFGVFRNRLTGFNDSDLNFHGLTLSVSLPTVDPVESGAWSVRADVEACPELELVLPARREAVETEFLKEMRDAARLAIYRAMAAADPEPRIAFKDRKRAAEGGIALPRAAGRTPPLAARPSPTSTTGATPPPSRPSAPPRWSWPSIPSRRTRRRSGARQTRREWRARGACSKVTRASRDTPGTTRSRA